MGFAEQLQQGKVAESKIANWLRFRCRYSVLPVYEIGENQYKGPQFYAPSGEFVAPDILAMREGQIKWIEAKHKSVFSWYRIGQCWVTGIDRHHYRAYLKIAEESEWPVWLMFYHTKSETTEGDGKCPSGLFGNDLSLLMRCPDHESDRWGKYGMIYWKHQDLKLLATCAEVESCQAMRITPTTTATGLTRQAGRRIS